MICVMVSIYSVLIVLSNVVDLRGPMQSSKWLASPGFLSPGIDFKSFSCGIIVTFAWQCSPSGRVPAAGKLLQHSAEEGADGGENEGHQGDEVSRRHVQKGHFTLSLIIVQM